MTDTPIRHCTVTVSGDRGAGKSTLISILAQALQGAGHDVSKPDHIKNASQAISDLHHKFKVHFVEAEEAETVTLTLAADTSPLREIIERNETLERMVEAANKREAELRAQLAKYPSPEEAAKRINHAITHVRDATLIQVQRENINRHVDSLKSESAKLRRESEARLHEANLSLTYALTGELKPSPTPASIQNDRRAAARQLSAEDKLALANGAAPKTAAEAVVAEVAAPTMDGADYGQPPAGEVTLAGEIARVLDGAATHPLFERLVEDR
jgi:hypothetical protein